MFSVTGKLSNALFPSEHALQYPEFMSPEIVKVKFCLGHSCLITTSIFTKNQLFQSFAQNHIVLCFF